MANTESSAVASSWSSIQSLTASLRNAADAENWPQVLELASARHGTLLRHFEQFPVGPANAEFYFQNLNQMLSAEAELQALTLAARKQVMRDGLTNNRNREAVAAYRIN
jgi:hypothetical protein